MCVSPDSLATWLLGFGTQLMRVILRNGMRRRLYASHILTLWMTISLLRLRLKAAARILLVSTRRLVKALVRV